MVGEPAALPVTVVHKPPVVTLAWPGLLELQVKLAAGLVVLQKLAVSPTQIFAGLGVVVIAAGD